MKTTIDAFDLIEMVWNRRSFVMFTCLVAGILGTAFVIMVNPRFSSTAVIAPLENNSAAGGLAKFGGAAAFLGTQFGLGRSQNMNEIAVILSSQWFAREVIDRFGFESLLYPDIWDESKGVWSVKDSAKIPSIQERTVMFQMRLSGVVDPQTGFLQIKLKGREPELVRTSLDSIVSCLNRILISREQEKAEINIQYLRDKMAEARDPELQSRIVGLMATELEKAVAISSRSFNVLQKPTLPPFPEFPMKKILVAAFVLLGFLLACMAVLLRDWLIPLFKSGG